MRTGVAEPAVATYGQVLAEPRFRVLFGTRSLAIAADALRSVALSVLVFELTASPLLAALTYGISFLPQLIGGILGGALADLMRPRVLIVTAYVLEFVTGLVLGLVHLPVWVALLAVAAVAAFTPVFAGASNRLVASVLTGDAYVLGRSLSNMAISAAQLIGLTFGGLAVATLGTRQTLLLSAIGHLVAAVAVRWRLPDLPANTAASGSGGSVLSESWSANRRLITDRAVRTLLLAQWLPPMFVTAAESLIIPYASTRGASARASGLLLGFLPLGMIVGDFVVGRYVRPHLRERLTVPLMAVLGLPLIGLVADVPLAIVAGLLAVSGTGFAYGLGIQRPFLDALPAADRGAAFGLLSTGAMTLQGVGPVLFGFLAEVTAVDTAMGMAGCATLLATLGLWAALRAIDPTTEQPGRRIRMRMSRASVSASRLRCSALRPGRAWTRSRGTGREIPLRGSDVTAGPVKVGHTVRRPHRRQSPAVAAYLVHLHETGFDAAPRWRGRDERGRDILGFVEGQVPGSPPPAWAVTDQVLVEVGFLLRRLHDASESFEPPADAHWFGQGLQVTLPTGLERLFDEPELISHCDVTPENTVFRQGHPVALIDFDVSRPTTRLLDVVDTATWWVPLVAPEDRAPAVAGVDVPARLRMFVDAYGLDEQRRSEFLDLAERTARRSWYLMQASAQQHGGGWARMWADGVGFWIRRRQEWLARERPTLAAALAPSPEEKLPDDAITAEGTG
jgi:predicted MFS family arabinose efflux permease